MPPATSRCGSGAHERDARPVRADRHLAGFDGRRRVHLRLGRVSRTAELDQLIADESLKPEETRAFVDRAFRDGAIQSSGTTITRILPPISRFDPDGAHGEQKARIVQKLVNYFDRFFGLGSS